MLEILAREAVCRGQSGAIELYAVTDTGTCSLEYQEIDDILEVFPEIGLIPGEGTLLLNRDKGQIHQVDGPLGWLVLSRMQGYILSESRTLALKINTQREDECFYKLSGKWSCYGPSIDQSRISLRDEALSPEEGWFVGRGVSPSGSRLD